MLTVCWTVLSGTLLSGQAHAVSGVLPHLKECAPGVAALCAHCFFALRMWMRLPGVDKAA